MPSRTSASRVPDAAAGKTQRFSLSRWFALTALVSISALALAVGASLDWFMGERMVAQEAALTREFVNSVLVAEAPMRDYIAEPSPERMAQVEASFEHLRAMTDVLRTNIYAPDQRVIWSSDPQLGGRRFGPNEELEAALKGALVAKREKHSSAPDTKSEHLALRGDGDLYVEIYVPVYDRTGQRLIGVFEFYKRPQTLRRALAELRIYIVVGAAACGLVLYLALFGLVRRADRTIQAQERQIVAQATLAALGEMSGAVAHGIRNPLAAIRSSAELIPGAGMARAEEAASDIVAQSDRLEAWVRELLSYTQPLDADAAEVSLQPLVERCLAGFARDLQRRGIAAEATLPSNLPAVRGDRLLLGQVLNSVVANALEALAQGGRIRISAMRSGARLGARDSVVLEVRDSGPGMPPEQLARVGQPFYTTKPRGMGVGLALARRVLERCGGQFEIDSAPGRGTVVRLKLLAA
jgi:two-component system, NtrC family, sensor histidine kinase HydH